MRLWHYTLIDPGNNAHRQLRNSLIVAVGAVLLGLPFSLPAAYALSRFRLRAKKYIMRWYIGLLMAPPVPSSFPIFILMTRIGWRAPTCPWCCVLQTMTIPFSSG